MRHLLYSLPHLRAAGWTVCAWCVQSDAPRDQVEHVFFPMPGKLRQLEGVLFFFRVNLYGLLLRLRGKPRPATIIQATLGTYLGADAVAVHFLSALWARRVLSLGLSGWKEYVGYVLTLWNAWCERVHLTRPAVRLALPVSDSIGAAVREWAAAGLRIETLPNSFDETRFNMERRARWRETQRVALGFGPEDQVFIFVSMGHYKRKGFWLAVDALHRLRTEAATEISRRSIRLLVVGGMPGTLATVASRLDDQYAGWRDWITLAGMQREVEKFYAAADFFLFPSYFEAFCLAEIEAAASGLPLLLTPHHGSEMILEDGKNGVRLSFDPAEMSKQIAGFLKNGLDGFCPGDAGRGLTREAYARELIRLYDDLLPPDTSTWAG